MTHSLLQCRNTELPDNQFEPSVLLFLKTEYVIDIELSELARFSWRLGSLADRQMISRGTNGWLQSVHISEVRLY